MPAISAAASAPSSASSGTSSRLARSATSSQVAARPGRPSRRRRPVFEAWWSTRTRGSRSNSRVPVSHVAEPVQRAAVTDDEEVVVAVRRRVGPEPIHPAQEAVQRGHRVRGQRVARATVVLDDRGDAERGAERVRVGVLVGDGQDASARGPRRRRLRAAAGAAASSHGLMSTPRVPMGAVPPAGLRGAAGLRRRGTCGVAVGRDPATGGGAVSGQSGAAGLELGKQAQHAGTSLGRVVERGPAAPGCGAAGSGGRARVGRTASRAGGPHRRSRSAGWPMTLTQTRAWLRSGVVSTSVTVTNPMRGSWMSFARMAPISWRRSSSIRSVRAVNPLTVAAARPTAPIGSRIAW